MSDHSQIPVIPSATTSDWNKRYLWGTEIHILKVCVAYCCGYVCPFVRSACSLTSALTWM